MITSRKSQLLAAKGNAIFTEMTTSTIELNESITVPWSRLHLPHGLRWRAASTNNF